MSTPHVFYPPWEPHTLPPLAILLLCWAFSNIVSVDLLGATYYSRSNCEMASSTCLVQYIISAPIAKGLQDTHPIPTPTTKGTSMTLPPLPHTTIGFDTTY